MKNTKKIGIYNHKGGVAKTTSVINLAYSIQKAGFKVLVVDCDSQENCYSFFSASLEKGNILPTKYENISHTLWEKYSALTEEEKNQFDFILFDLPPTLSDEVRAVLRQCNKVYVPIVLGEFEIAGLRKVTEEINRLNVKLGGIFVTKYQARNDAELIEEFRAALMGRMMETVIPYSLSIRESQKAGLPIEAYFVDHAVPHNPQSWKIVYAYENLANEIMRGA